jgi:hypothetical protein
VVVASLLEKYVSTCLGNNNEREHVAILATQINTNNNISATTTCEKKWPRELHV